MARGSSRSPRRIKTHTVQSVKNTLPNLGQSLKNQTGVAKVNIQSSSFPKIKGFNAKGLQYPLA